jgi:hypothetical protein
MVLPKPCDLEALHRAVHHALTRETDACLQEILERGRLGFWMVMLRERQAMEAGQLMCIPGSYAGRTAR